MDNRNQNENLTPDELVQKLKEKLAKDRDIYSKMVESDTDTTIGDAIAENDASEQEDMLYEDVEQVSDKLQTEVDDEVFEQLAEELEYSEAEEDAPVLDESDNGEEILEAAVELDGEEYAEIEFDEADEARDAGAETVEQLDAPDAFDDGITGTFESEAPTAEDVSDGEASKEDDYVDMRIQQMLAELEDTSIDTAEDEKLKVSDTDSSDDMEATSVFAAALSSDQAFASETEEKKSAGNVNAGNVKKPTVYRFRRSSAEDEAEHTKLHNAVKLVENDSKNDNEKTKLNDVPELEKPDLNVMQTFGATVEHVRELYGDEVADEYEKILVNSDLTERRAAEYEYTSTEQKSEIYSEFKNKMVKSRWKIVLCAVMCGFMLLLENIGIFGISFGGILDARAYPVSNIMIDLQLLLICAALAFPIIKRGFADIAILEPSSKSVTAAIVTVAVIIDIISAFIGGDVALYNFSAGVAVLFSMIFDVKALKRDYMTFKVLSSDRTKSAAIVSIGTSKSPEVAAYEQLGEDEEVKIISMQRGRFVKDFFARTKQSDSSPQDKIILPLTVATMIIIFVVSLVMHGNASNALKIANMSFSAFVPFAVYFSLSFPISKASVSVYENGAAIVGDAALEEYSGASIICFEDKDVFPSYCVKLKSVKVYGDSRIDKVLYNASSVFSKLGGPLSDVLSLSTVEIGNSDDVEIIDAQPDGVEAVVDGKRILIGKASFLTKYEIFARKDESDTEDYCRMYIAEGDFLSAKFYVKYNLDVDFENVISRMAGSGICAVLKTFDPNIDDKMLSKHIDTAKYPIRVVKCKVGEEVGVVQDEVDSGVISTNGAKNTVEAAVTCERLYNICLSANTTKIVAMIIGIVISAFIAIFGVTPFYSVFIVLYQLLWMIPAIISGKLSL